MERYKLYLFDFDGTLADSFEALAMVFKRSFEAVGIKIKDEDVSWLSRVPLDESYAKLGAPEDKADLFIEKIKEYLHSEESIKLTKFYSDALDFFERATKEGIKMGVVTSNEKKHVYDILESAGLPIDIFDVVVGSDECLELKPKPDSLLMALDKLDYKGSLDDVVYVGDSHNDYQCAINAKVNPILIVRDGRDTNGFNAIYKLTELLDF